MEEIRAVVWFTGIAMQTSESYRGRNYPSSQRIAGQLHPMRNRSESYRARANRSRCLQAPSGNGDRNSARLSTLWVKLEWITSGSEGEMLWSLSNGLMIKLGRLTIGHEELCFKYSLVSIILLSNIYRKNVQNIFFYDISKTRKVFRKYLSVSGC